MLGQNIAHGENTVNVVEQDLSSRKHLDLSRASAIAYCIVQILIAVRIFGAEKFFVTVLRQCGCFEDIARHANTLDHRLQIAFM